jgi:hypothetical protein
MEHPDNQRDSEKKPSARNAQIRALFGSPPKAEELLATQGAGSGKFGVRIERKCAQGPGHRSPKPGNQPVTGKPVFWFYHLPVIAFFATGLSVLYYCNPVNIPGAHGSADPTDWNKLTLNIKSIADSSNLVCVCRRPWPSAVAVAQGAGKTKIGDPRGGWVGQSTQKD